MPKGGGPFKQPIMLGPLFNQAHPDFILKAFPEGAAFEASGMTPSDGSSPGVFKAPIRKPALRVRLEAPSGAPVPDPGLVIAWDLVCVVPEDRRYYVVGRAAWTYDPKADCKRNARVLPA